MGRGERGELVGGQTRRMGGVIGYVDIWAGVGGVSWWWLCVGVVSGMMG